MSDPQDTRFPPGHSGNPAGRPPGSRNKATLAREAALEERAVALAERAIESQRVVCDALTRRALAGETRAIRLMLSSYLERAILLHGELDVPNLDSVEGVLQAGQAILTATAAGEMAVQDALALQKVLHNHLRMVHSATARTATARTATATAGARPAPAADTVVPVTTAAPRTGIETGQEQENTGPAAPPRRPPARPDPHANCRNPMLPMAQWLQVTGMGARLAASKRLAEERLAA